MNPKVSPIACAVRCWSLVLAALAWFAASTSAVVVAQTDTDLAPAAPASKSHPGRLARPQPAFVENHGQWPDETVRFALVGSEVNVGLTDTGIRYQMFSRRSEPARLPSMHEFATRFVGARTVTPTGENPSAVNLHDPRGGAALRWQEVPGWTSVVYGGLYTGMDLRVTSARAGVKYEFVVNPGADWRQIRMRCDGVEQVALEADGSLTFHPGPGLSPLRDHPPLIYQEFAGSRRIVNGRFVLLDSRTFGFAVDGDYDRTRPLIIDPQVEWSTYLGGQDDEYGRAITTDSAGNVIVAGCSASGGWVSGGYDTQYGGRDGYVAKFSPTGQHLWSTYLGSDGLDPSYGVAVDKDGNVLITGAGTYSPTPWISGGYNTNHGGVPGDSDWDAWVVKLSPMGAHLWSTWLGGIGYDEGRAIAADSEGNVLVAGYTWSTNWVTGGWKTTLGGGSDGFVVKLSPAGAHVWSTYLGGTNDDSAWGIAVDANRNVLVAGRTASGGWVSGGYDTSQNGADDAFVVKLSPTGTHVWSTYLGGSEADFARGVAVDNGGNVLVTGGTASAGWVSGGFNTSHAGLDDVFVAKLSSAGGHTWSTYLGGSEEDYGCGIAVDGVGNVLVTGSTRSSGWATNGFDSTYKGSQDAFVTRLTLSGGHSWSSYLGGEVDEEGLGVAVDRAGGILVSGVTTSLDWTAGGWDTSHNGLLDAFVVKVFEGISLKPTRSEAGQIRVAFEAPGFTASGFVFESTSALTNPVPWQPVSGAVIVTNAPGSYEAQAPLPTEPRFYRVRTAP